MRPHPNGALKRLSPNSSALAFAPSISFIRIN